jgi:hypothetical protein
MKYQERVLLLMKYDNNKTLTENKEELLTEAVITPLTRMLKSLASLTDKTLDDLIGKSKSEITNLLKKRKTTADINDIFNSIKNHSDLAKKLFTNEGLFTAEQLKNTVKSATDIIGSDSTAYPRVVSTLTDSLLSKLKLPQSARPLIEEYSTLVQQSIKRQLKVDYPNVYKKLFNETPISKIDWSDIEKVTPNLFSRFLADNKTLGTKLRLTALQFARTRPIFDSQSGKWYYPFKSRVDSTLTDIFGKLKTIVGNYETGAGFKGTLKDSDNLFRDIQASLNSLHKGNADYEKIVEELEEVMLQGGVDRDTVYKIGKYIKDNDPWTQKSWLRKVIGESSFAKAIKGVFSKDLTWYQKLWNLVQRTLMFLTTGSIKTWDEILEFFASRNSPGLIKGGLQYYFFMLWVSNGVLPVVLSFFGTLLAMAKGALFGYQNQTFVDELEKQYYEYWVKMTTTPDGNTNYLQTLIPWTNFWDDINDIANGLISGTVNISEYIQKYIKNANQKAMEDLKIGMEELNKLKKEFEDMKKGVVNKKLTEVTVDAFYSMYPCYEKVIDKTYGDRGLKIIDDNTIELKYKNVEIIYKAELKPDGKLYWENSTTALGC